MSRQIVEETAVERKTPGSGSARKVLQILFSFSERQTAATVAELANLVGAPIQTAYRHVALLKELQLLEEGPAGTYHPTAKVMSLARAAQLSNTLPEIARPIVVETSDAFNETVMLMQHYGEGVICVEVKETDRAMRYTFERGHATPLGIGASGKMVLASLSLRAQEAWLRNGRTPGLKSELAEIGRRGYATSDGELDEGVWACSVSVTTGTAHPVVLTVAGPAVRIDEAMRQRAPILLREHADRIRELAGRYAL